jgi:hypothetical protein
LSSLKSEDRIQQPVASRQNKSTRAEGMRMKKRLTRKQLAVLDDLFGSDGSAGEQQILEKHEVSAAEYRRWYSEEAFAEEFEARMEALGRQGRLLIARYASYAAAKLIALTESENQETARKACLDIIDRIQNTEFRVQSAEERGQRTDDREYGLAEEQLTPELAEKILETLAEGK